MEYRIYKVSADFMIKVVNLFNKCKDIGREFNKSVVMQALETSEVNAQNAIGAIEQLGLFNVSEKIASSPIEEQKMLFREALQSYKPFLDFLEFLYKGYSPKKAVRMVKSLYSLKRREGDILWTFRNWGIFGGIFKEKRGALEFSEAIQRPVPSKIIRLTEILNDELKAKIWIKNTIGKAESFLSSEEFNSLVRAMMEFEKDPRGSVRHAGEALEDFLRKIAEYRNIDVTKKKGISEIAEGLRKNRVVASKHIGILKGLEVFLDRDIFDGFSAFRNMAYHGIDKDEGKRWELSSELALTYVIQVILCIKSLYYYGIEKKLNF